MGNQDAARIAISGTPASGKSTLCTTLCTVEEKWRVENIEDLAESADALGPIDAEDGARPIDIENLRTHLRDWNSPPSAWILVDGHLSHLLPVDAIVFIRCHPTILNQRLTARDWSNHKIAENCEWELLGAGWSDVDEIGDLPILELDSSEVAAEQLAKSVNTWVANGYAPRRPANTIDWIERIHG